MPWSYTSSAAFPDRRCRLYGEILVRDALHRKRLSALLRQVRPVGRFQLSYICILLFPRLEVGNCDFLRGQVENDALQWFERFFCGKLLLQLATSDLEPDCRPDAWRRQKPVECCQ